MPNVLDRSRTKGNHGSKRQFHADPDFIELVDSQHELQTFRARMTGDPEAHIVAVPQQLRLLRSLLKRNQYPTVQFYVRKGIGTLKCTTPTVRQLEALGYWTEHSRYSGGNCVEYWEVYTGPNPFIREENRTVWKGDKRSVERHRSLIEPGFTTDPIEVDRG